MTRLMHEHLERVRHIHSLQGDAAWSPTIEMRSAEPPTTSKMFAF